MLSDSTEKLYEELGRKLLPWVIGMAMSLGAIVGLRVLAEQDKLTTAFGAMQTDLAVMKVDIQYLRDKNELARTGTR